MTTRHRQELASEATVGSETAAKTTEPGPVVRFTDPGRLAPDHIKCVVVWPEEPPLVADTVLLRVHHHEVGHRNTRTSDVVRATLKQRSIDFTRS